MNRDWAWPLAALGALVIVCGIAYGLLRDDAPGVAPAAIVAGIAMLIGAFLLGRSTDREER